MLLLGKLACLRDGAEQDLLYPLGGLGGARQGLRNVTWISESTPLQECLVRADIDDGAGAVAALRCYV